MKKNLIYIIIGVIVVVGIIVGFVFGIQSKKSKGLKLETTAEMKAMFEKIYSDLGNTLPSLETNEIDVNDANLVTTYTGLKSNKDIEAVVVSEPLMNAQAYSAVAVKVKDGEEIDRFSEFINPEEPIPYSIEQLTSITDEMMIFQMD